MVAELTVGGFGALRLRASRALHGSRPRRAGRFVSALALPEAATTGCPGMHPVTTRWGVFQMVAAGVPFVSDPFCSAASSTCHPHCTSSLCAIASFTGSDPTFRSSGCSVRRHRDANITVPPFTKYTCPLRLLASSTSSIRARVSVLVSVRSRLLPCLSGAPTVLAAARSPAVSPSGCTCESGTVGFPLESRGFRSTSSTGAAPPLMSGPRLRLGVGRGPRGRVLAPRRAS